jgi:translation initiation factor IF-2
MSRIRVMELAKELGLENKAAIAKLEELGIHVKNHFNALTDLEAEKLRSFLRTGKNPEKAPERAQKVVIRRRPTANAKATSEPKDEAKAEEPAAPQPRFAIRRREDIEQPASQSTAADQTPGQDSVEMKPQPDAPAASEPRIQDSAPVRPPVTPPEQTARAAITVSPVAEPQKPVETASQSPAETKRADSGQQAATAAPSAPRAGAGAKAPERPQSAVPGRPQGRTPTGGSLPPRGPVPPAREPASAAPPAPNRVLRPGASPGGATIVRRADRDSGAVIVRRGAPPPQHQGQHSDDGGRGYRGRSEGFRPAGSSTTGGGYSRPSTGGGYGGSQRPNGPQGPGGFRSGPGARPGGAPGGSSGPRPGGFGGPRPPGRSDDVMGIGGLTDETTGKPLSRDRVKDKDRDREKRRHIEEENRKKAKLKGATQDVEFEIDEEEAESAGVRNFIPARRRTGRRKEAARQRHELKPMKASKRVVRIYESISVADLAQEMSVKSSAVIKTLMSLGTLATVNQSLDADTATIVAQDFGFEVQNTAKSIGDILSTSGQTASQQDALEQFARPPVVTIMGHVDHGKTSLLDAIRHSNKTDQEAGGITQHIGAYQVEKDGRRITFIDTPGHAAFTEMRARGARVTDVAILVVAADDGVMPQTIEAINHAKAAEVPIVVAVNKMDKPEANYDRILAEMASHGVSPEDWGGDAMFVKCSAHTKEGISDLLEAILLQAEVLELTARHEGLAEGVVIESQLDKARGPVATFLITKGVLHKGDTIVVGTSSGRVRALFDDQGNKVEEAGPSMPVEVLGLDTVPSAGDPFNVVANESVARQAVQYRADRERREKSEARAKTSIQDLLSQLGSDSAEKKSLPVIIKADTHGSVEAIRGALEKLATDKVSCKFVHAAVGGITETDVTLGMTAQALVLGFNVRPDKKSADLAEEHGVQIETFSVIYELIDTVEKAMAGKLEPIRHERIQGHAEVRETFSVPKVGVIAGSAVTDGKITRSSLVRVVRDGIVLFTGRISSLKRFKDDAKEVSHGYECGIGVENFNNLKPGDILESFYIEEVAATLRPTGAAELGSN